MGRIHVTRSHCGLLLGGLLLVFAGCGGGRHPDSGVGAAEVVPASINCTDLAERFGSCFEVLCNENTMSSRYTGLGDILASQFEAQCTDDLLQSKLTASQWSCAFQSSCREVLDYDDCHVDASFSCT